MPLFQPIGWPLGLVMAGVAACSPGRQPPESQGQHHSCADGQPLSVIRSGNSAIVKVGERIFTLHARKTSLGQRYSDGKATLIMDDLAAVFVAEDGARTISCALNNDR